MNSLVKALEPFAKMYKELTESKVLLGGTLFQYNSAEITVNDLLNATNALSLYSQSAGVEIKAGLRFILRDSFDKTIFTIEKIEVDKVFVGWPDCDRKTEYELKDVGLRFSLGDWIIYQPKVSQSKEGEDIDGEFRMILSHAFLGCDISDISKETFDLAISECVKYANKLLSKENEGKQAGVEDAAKEYCSAIWLDHGAKFNGLSPSHVQRTIKDFIAGAKWASGERGEVERLKGEIERLKEKIEILEIGNKRVDINSPF